jgi:hypothetical protein
MTDYEGLGHFLTGFMICSVNFGTSLNIQRKKYFGIYRVGNFQKYIPDKHKSFSIKIHMLSDIRGYAFSI